VIDQQPALARQFFPEGGQPYPIPLPPEGSQSDPLNTGHPTIIVRSFTVGKSYFKRNELNKSKRSVVPIQQFLLFALVSTLTHFGPI